MAELAPDIVQKWGKSVAERGFAQIPNYLLLLNHFLDPDVRLKPLDLLLLIQLIGTWWKKEDQPFPSVRTLAIRCGTSERQIHRSISTLININLLAKNKRRIKGIISSNTYDMKPLVSFLNEVSGISNNEFPRDVSIGKVRKIRSIIAGIENKVNVYEDVIKGSKYAAIIEKHEVLDDGNEKISMIVRTAAGDKVCSSKDDAFAMYDWVVASQKKNV